MECRKDIEEIINTALDANEAALLRCTSDIEVTGTDSRDLQCAAAGFAVGFQAAVAISGISQEGTPLLMRVSSGVIRRLDDFLLTGDPEAVTIARNDLAGYVSTIRSFLKSASSKARARVFGSYVSGLLDLDSITDDDSEAIGMAVALREDSAYLGYLLYRDDESLSCRCPACLSSAIDKKGSTLADPVVAARTQFGSNSAALRSFGRVYFDFVKASEARALGDDVGVNVDSHEAGVLTDEFLRGFAAGGKK